MKILLTGASGFVGSAVARAAARRGHAVIGTVGQFAGEIDGLQRRIALNLTDEAAISAAVEDEVPTVVINCAAISVPAACDADPVRSQALNVTLPAFLARLARLVGARF